MNFSLPAFALQRPVTVLMLSICMLGLGGIAWYLMPAKFLPEATPPFVNVQIPYPGASPEQVEVEVAIPAEGEFRTIPGLEQIRTISDSNGCFINMRYSLDTDMNQAAAEVRDRMERLKLVLPENVDRMLLQRFNSRSIPVVAVGLFSPQDPDEFVHLVRSVLDPRLRRVDGVADVAIFTTRPEKEVLVEFDQDTLQSVGLNIYDVVGELRGGSLNLTVGELLDGETKFFIRATDEFRRIEDIREQIVSPKGLRLKDVASVRYASRDESMHVAIDGQGGAFVMVIKESEANTVATAEAVIAELDKLPQDPLFAESDSYVFFNQAALINNALENLFDAGRYGAVMALIVLFIFLHRVRPTIIVAFAIPTSLVFALVVMFFFDMTLNLVSMVSMIIAIGLLVDNAIVVVENIIRYRQNGLDAHESAKRGASEVGLAIFAATSTTWVVFLPMFYMETGRMSVFMRELAVPMTASLAGSLLLALTVIPLLMSRMPDTQRRLSFGRLSELARGGRPQPASQLRLPGWMKHLLRTHPIRGTVDSYGVLLDQTLRWRLLALLLLGGLLVLTYYVPFRGVQMQDLPKLDTREVEIEVELDQNFDLAMAEEVFDDVIGLLEPNREKWGVRNIFSRYTSDGGEIDVFLMTEEDDPAYADPAFSTEDVLAEIQALLPQRKPGVLLEAEITDAGESGTGRGVSVRMRGNVREELEGYTAQFMSAMRQIDRIKNVSTSLPEDETEMQLLIDEPIAERQGVSPLVLAQTVDIALRGSRLPYMKSGGREVAVWGQFSEEDRRRKENLETIAVPSALGAAVPLERLVDFQRAPSPESIVRVNGKNEIMIYAQVEGEGLTDIRDALKAQAAQFDMPLGYSIEFGDELAEIQQNLMNFTVALYMAIILIYLVMAALFESFILPLSILTTVPLAFVGVYWMMWLTGTSIDLVTLIGCILMVGLIVNNGIVIVDHMNMLRKQMGDRNKAIVQAGKDRFRPVMMTALTTILGVVPLAIAQTGGAVTFNGLGRAIIGGLISGTLLTLLIVPLFYTLLDDLGRWIGNYAGNLSGLRGNRRPRSV